VVNRFVMNVQPTQQVKVPIQPPVNHVTLVNIPSRVVLNVPCVVLELMVLDANRVPLVNTAMAPTLLRSLAEIARPVTTMTTTVRVLVYHAYPVNSIILPVLSSANLAKKILFQKKRIGPCPVTNVPPERHLFKEVSDAIVIHAKQVPLIKVVLENVSIVHKVGNRKIWMLQDARGAHPAKLH
jgi:hypothetical protein